MCEMTCSQRFVFKEHRKFFKMGEWGVDKTRVAKSWYLFKLCVGYMGINELTLSNFSCMFGDFHNKNINNKMKENINRKIRIMFTLRISREIGLEPSRSTYSLDSVIKLNGGPLPSCVLAKRCSGGGGCTQGTCRLRLSPEDTDVSLGSSHGK